MRTKDIPTPDPYPQPAVQAVRHFCKAYPAEQAQQELWRWFILALKEGYDGLSSARTTNLITFYENLKTHISAVYQIHDLSSQEETVSLTTNDTKFGNSTAESTSLAAALNTLHTQLSHSWTLLICPPE